MISSLLLWSLCSCHGSAGQRGVHTDQDQCGQIRSPSEILSWKSEDHEWKTWSVISQVIFSQNLFTSISIESKEQMNKHLLVIEVFFILKEFGNNEIWQAISYTFIDLQPPWQPPYPPPHRMWCSKYLHSCMTNPVCSPTPQDIMQ